MIAIFKSTECGLQQVETIVDGVWINVVDPNAEEVAQLKELGMPADFLTYPLDVDERARSEKNGDSMLIVVRVPHFRGHGADIPYATIPLGIVLGPGWIITVCKYENELIKELIENSKGASPAKRYRFALRLLLNAATKYLSYLRIINKNVDLLEDKLQLSIRNREVLELLKYQKSLEYLATALRSNELMMERLQKSRIFTTYPEDEDLLDDVMTENQQAIEMTTIASNILSSMMDAFASMISNNLNTVIKVLTSVTILLSLPTLVASFYGMNVPLPLAEWQHAFPAIMAVSVFMMAIAVFVFKRKDWF
jgi:magnesium transporter